MKDLITPKNGKTVTTSLKVAEVFEKRHDNVIRAIKDLHCSEDFLRSNFEEFEIITENAIGLRQTHRHYEITKQGLVFLAMGFNGKKAAAFKEAYIDEFDRMEAFIKEQQKSETLPMSDDELISRALIASHKILHSLEHKGEAIPLMAEPFDEFVSTDGNTDSEFHNLTNPAEAARAWADEVEKRQIAAGKAEELTSKAETFNEIISTDGKTNSGHPETGDQ